MIALQQYIPGRLGRRLAALGLCFALTLTAIPLAGAVSQSDIDDLESQQAVLQDQMDSLQAQIDDLEAQENTALQQALLYQEQLGVLTQQVSDTQAVIDDYTVQIADTQVQLADAQAKAEEYYQIFCERFRQMEEAGSVSYWSILFDSASFSDLLDRLNFIRDVATYDNSVVDALEAARQEVADTEARLEEEKAAQESALSELQTQQAAIEDASAKNDAMIAEVQANQAAYADQLAAMEEENDELAQNIITTKAEYEAQLERQRQEEEARKKEEEARKKQEAANSSSNTSTSGSGSSSSSGSGSSGGSSAPVSGNGSDVVAYAMQFLGNPYVWGGTSLTNGVDCSGFTMQIYRHFGVSLSHSSWAQAGAGVGVSASEAQPGDLVFYRSSGSATGGHVGIYLGNGEIISALGSKWGICISSISGKSNVVYRRLV